MGDYKEESLEKVKNDLGLSTITEEEEIEYLRKFYLDQRATPLRKSMAIENFKNEGKTFTGGLKNIDYDPNPRFLLKAMNPDNGSINETENAFISGYDKESNTIILQNYV